MCIRDRNIASLTKTGITNIRINYTDRDTWESVFADLDGTKAEIRAKVSSTPCLLDPSDSYWNEIDLTWTLIKSDWTPLLEENTNGYADVNTLISLLADGGNYLCISLSHSGQSIAGSDIHKHWFLDNINIIINGEAVEEPENISTSLHLNQPVTSANQGDTITFTGSLTRNDNGNGISSQTISIYNSDNGVEELIASGATDANGNFAIEWNAVRPSLDDDSLVQVIAKYSGSGDYSASTSSNTWSINIIYTIPDPVITSITLSHTPLNPDTNNDITVSVLSLIHI